MNGAILLDTDIVIDFLRGNTQAVAHVKSVAELLCFSAITVAEIHVGVRGAKEETEVKRLFSLFPVIAVSGETARTAGRLVRQYRPSHSVELPDAIIAATCMASGARLHTLNTRHYPMFKDLKPPYNKKAG